MTKLEGRGQWTNEEPRTRIPSSQVEIEPFTDDICFGIAEAIEDIVRKGLSFLGESGRVFRNLAEFMIVVKDNIISPIIILPSINLSFGGHPDEAGPPAAADAGAPSLAGEHTSLLEALARLRDALKGTDTAEDISAQIRASVREVIRAVEEEYLAVDKMPAGAKDRTLEAIQRLQEALGEDSVDRPT